MGQESRFYALCKRYIVRNPDPWMPQEPPRRQAPESRRPALAGLLIVLCLIVGGLLLTHVLSRLAQVQDCALSGRSNCGFQR
jgi:hypothetical protein